MREELNRKRYGFPQRWETMHSTPSHPIVVNQSGRLTPQDAQHPASSDVHRIDRHIELCRDDVGSLSFQHLPAKSVPSDSPAKIRRKTPGFIPLAMIAMPPELMAISAA